MLFSITAALSFIYHFLLQIFKMFGEFSALKVMTTIITIFSFWLLCLLVASLIFLLPLSCTSGDISMPTELPSPGSHQQIQEDKLTDETKTRTKRPRGRLTNRLTAAQPLLSAVKTTLITSLSHNTSFLDCGGSFLRT